MKIDIIQQNQHLYSVSAMCNVLQIASNTFYYETSVSVEEEHQKAQAEQDLKEEIRAIFHENRHVYGRCKLKKVRASAGSHK